MLSTDRRETMWGKGSHRGLLLHNLGRREKRRGALALQYPEYESLLDWLYGLTSNATDALLIEPGTFCAWL